MDADALEARLMAIEYLLCTIYNDTYRQKGASEQQIAADEAIVSARMDRQSSDIAGLAEYGHDTAKRHARVHEHLLALHSLAREMRG